MGGESMRAKLCDLTKSAPPSPPTRVIVVPVMRLHELKTQALRYVVLGDVPRAMAAPCVRVVVAS